jgi:polyhydroxyalkanoate synthesis repressor PhaR
LALVSKNSSGDLILTIVIKRYPNRKLYNTKAKEYITLDGVADLIRDGNTIQVIDNKTGSDLTSLTLSQIIFEQEKKQAGFLPRSVLAGLIQSGGNKIEIVRRTLAAPLELMKQIDEEIENRLNLLIDHGEISQEDGLELKERLLSPELLAKTSKQSLEKSVERLLNAGGVPSRSDLDELVFQIDDLTTKVDELSRKRSKEE